METVETRDAGQLKGAQNQSLIREVNERIWECSSPSLVIEVICECADSACDETLPMTRDEYEAIRSHPTWFPIKPGHEDPKIERIVDESGVYVVVKKIEHAATVAEKLDPRSRSKAEAT